MRTLLLTLLILVAACVATSCIEDDFTTSPSDTLTFSTDTLSFDTVFTDLGTPTARLKVFNRAGKSVNISRISFKNPDTRFAMNVDGVSASSFTDVEIRANDSIFIFVECKLPLEDVNTPVLTEDAIEFLTNGVQQQVVLQAWGQNVTRLRGQTLTADTRFTAERPIVVFDSLVVAEGATLRIDPGVQLLFHDKAFMRVKGRIEAVGEPGRMIAMRGDRLDNVLPDVGYDIMAGQWKGITIDAGSFGNRLEYVDMRSTVSGLQIDSCSNLSERKLLLLNSWLHNSQGRVLESRHAWVDALGCVFSEAADHVVCLEGGRHTMTQCTFANNYLFAAPYQSIIGLYGLLPDEGGEGAASGLPLMEASFNNCIVYGMASDLNVGDLTGSQVFFRYTLMRSGGQDDDNFLHCLWDADPLFYTVRTDYLFNYRVKPDSPAIGAGDPALVTPQCEYDMDGVWRLGPGGVTLGAYQYVAPPEEGSEQ